MFNLSYFSTFQFCICGSSNLVSPVFWTDISTGGLSPALTADMHFSVHWALTCLRPAGGRPYQLRLYCLLYMTCSPQDAHCKAFVPLLNSVAFALHQLRFHNIVLEFWSRLNSFPANMTHLFLNNILQTECPDAVQWCHKLPPTPREALMYGSLRWWRRSTFKYNITILLLTLTCVRAWMRSQPVLVWRERAPKACFHGNVFSWGGGSLIKNI